MGKTNAPCVNCQERDTCCHSVCEDYIEYANEQELKRAWKFKNNEIENYYRNRKRKQI